MPLSAVKIHVSVFDEASIQSCYLSYTLPNTPFYFKPVWSDNIERQNYSQYQILWNFGDGTYYTGPSAYHTYSYPGIYNFSATFYDINGTPVTVYSSTDSTTATPVIALTALNALPDTIVFEPVQAGLESGVLLLPAGQQSPPLRISRYNSWQNNSLLQETGYTINLYASGSNSNYISLSGYYSNKWSHLKAYFGFVETYITSDNIVSSKLVDSTTTNSVSVYAEKNKASDNKNIQLSFYSYKKQNTAFAGTSGTATNSNKVITFVDQKPSKNSVNSIVFLFAHPETSRYPDFTSLYNNYYQNISFPAYGYFNTKTSTQYLRSVFNPAGSLAITSNGITVEGNNQTVGPLTGQLIHSFNIYPTKWVDQEIPFVITFKDINNYTTKCYPPLTGFKTDGTPPTEVNTVSLNLYKLAELDPLAQFVPISSYRINEAIFTENLKAPKFEKSGSYFCGLLKMPYESTVVIISAAALIQDEPSYNLGASFGYAGQPGIKSIKRFRRRPIFSFCNQEELTLSFTGESKTYVTSQSAATPISVSPLKSYGQGDKDKVWVADSDQDIIYIYESNGTLLNTLILSAMPVYTTPVTPPVITDLRGELQSAKPTNIAINSKGDAWVTLYDSVTCVKISDSSLQVISRAVPSVENTAYINITDYALVSGFAGENSLLPTTVDVDKDDNIWVAYSHPVSGFLIKYRDDGTILKVINIPPFLSLQEIVIDKDNNVFGIAVNLDEDEISYYDRNDKVYKWDSGGNLTTGFPLTLKSVGNITTDLQQNAWISHGVSKISRVTPTNAIEEFTLGSQTPLYEYFQPIGGIATDTEGYLWVVHNTQGKIFFFPITQPIQTNIEDIEYGLLPDIQFTLPEGVGAFYNVIGDWTGSRWYSKFYTQIKPLPRIVTGTSNLFNILNNSPIINKVNENFDQAAQYRKYVLQESLFDKDILFDDFLGQIVGNVDSDPSELGKTVYEKIANFVANISDPEVCNINALESLHNQYGLPFYNFSKQYPAKLKRVMDILSINQTKLFGSPNMYNNNFGLTAFGYNQGKNLGDAIPIDTGKFKIGSPIVAYEKFSEQFKLITNTIVPETNNVPVVVGELYPLSGVNYDWGWGLVTGTNSQSGIEIEPYYIFYEYIPYYPKNMVDGVIDFNNPLTTITPKASSHADWTKFGGTIEQVISRTFAEGLNFV